MVEKKPETQVDEKPETQAEDASVETDEGSGEESTATFTRPATQLDLEARQENKNESFRKLSTAEQVTEQKPVPGRDYVVEGNDVSSYFGAIDPEYQTYANDTEKPYNAEGGPEAVLEKQLSSDSSTPVTDSAKPKKSRLSGSR